MKAPNGQPSNLTPEQYKLVRTKAFKDWFGDWENDPANASKVVDENGEPLVVYRGMPKKRRVGNIFRYNVNLFGTKGVGGRQTNFFSFYFTDIKKVAENYGENLSEEDGGYVVKPYFLNVRNLFQAFTRKNEYELTFKKLYDIANKTGKPIYEKNYKGEIETDFRGNKIEWKDQSYEWRNQYDSPQLQETFVYFVDWNKNQANQWFWRNYLQQHLNYDGLVFYETSQNRVWDKNDKVKPLYGDEFSKTFGVFEPNQIKLADGSNTTFDGSNLDIRYADGGSVKRYNKTSENYGKPKDFDDWVFIHQTSKENGEKIIQNGFKASSNPNITNGVYSVPENWYDKPLSRIEWNFQIKFKLKKNSKIFWTDCERPTDFYYGNGNKFYEKLYKKLNEGHLNPFESLQLGEEERDEHTKKFLRNFEKWLSKNDYSGVQQGGEIVITDLQSIEIIDSKQLFSNGGSIKRYNKEIMKKIKRGGITYGASHDNGGIPVKNASTGDMLEVEGGEGIVNKRSMASGKKVKLNGQEMTICEAVSQLNQMEGGVSFSCDDVEDMQFIEEMALGGELERGVRTEKEHIQVLKDLYSKRITPNEATRKIAEDHLKEDERYYSKLAKMEGKMAKGGEIYDDEGNVIYLKVGDRVIEFRQKTPNNPKSQIGGEGKIIQIVGVMAKVVFEPNDYEQWIALKDLKKIDDGKMAKGGKVGESYKVPSSEDLVEMVMKAKDKAIRKNRELGIPVVIGRYDGYGAILSNGKDFETILSTRPSRRKVIEIIENNPDIIEVFFLGTIKGADRVGEEMEYLDDFVVTLWKKPIDLNNAIGTTFQWTDTIQDPKNPNKEIRADEKIWMIVKQEDAHVYKDRPTDDNYFYINTFNEKNGEQSARRMPKSDFQVLIDEGFIEIVEVSQALKEQILKPMPNYERKMAKGGSVSTLLAPNGKPSNLNAEQYHLVRTPEFKAWFGDWEKLAMAKVKDPAMDEVTLANLSKDVSKVVDENGEPLVVYHFTSYDFNIFEYRGYSQGFFFTPNKNTDFGYRGSRMITAFLNIKTLSELSNIPKEKWSVPMYENFHIENSQNDKDYQSQKTWDESILKAYPNSDGIKFISDYGDQIIVAFKPNQIKLADGTNTTFDGGNPDIRFEDGGETDEDNLSYAEAQERWNKKAGIPSQKEALTFVKENPEILAMLKNGGEIMDCGCGSYGNGGYVDTFVDERIVSKVEDKDNPFAKFGLKKNFRGDTFVRLDAIEEKSINFCDSFPQVCGKNMGILREDMPQIYEEYIPEYLDFLKDMGVDAKLEYDIPVKELTATQEDISVPRMSRMLKRLLSGYYIDSDGNRINPLKRKLIITKDNYVLDGHHRWATMYFLSPNNTIDALRVNADIKDIVPISKNFGMVQFQKFMYGGKVGVTGFTDIDGLGVEPNASSLKYLKIYRNIFPKAGLKISPLITFNYATPPQMVFSQNGFQIDDIGKRNLKFNTLRDIKSSLSSNVNDAIADYNLSIPDKDKQIFLENVSYSTTLEDGLFAVRRVLTSVNQIDTPAISILFYQYKSASITFSFIFNDKFIKLYGDDLDVLEAILNGFSQIFKDSDNMGALVIEGNFTRSRKPRTAKPQPQQPTQNEWYWRFKTEKELKDEYGDNWMDSISWSSNMNDLLGGEIDENTLSKDFIEEAKLIGKAYTNTVEALGLPIGANSKNWYATIPFKVLTNKPLPSQQKPTQQGGYWRFKTEQEFIDEYGDNWRGTILWSPNSDMDYLLGKRIENFNADGKPKSGDVNTEYAYGITSGKSYSDDWLIKDEYFKFVPETTQAPTQQGGYWRFKTEQELKDYLGDNWQSEIKSGFSYRMDYLLGQKIDNDKLVNGKPQLDRAINTKYSYGIEGMGSNVWDVIDERLFKFIPETTQQTSNSQLVPTKELDKKIQEVQDLMNSELFSPDEVVVQQVLIDELKNLNEQKQKSILSNYYSNDLNDLLQLYAQNISKGQRLTMDVACGKETPSGMPSELDETQYTLVRTPQFKAWFGDWEEAYKTKNYSGVSKAINEKTGEPLVVYHGKGNMKVEATYFKLTGFPIKYFAENKSYSEWFKNNYNAVNILYEFFINVSNPIDLSMVGLDEITPQTFVDLIEALYDYKIQTPLMMPDRAVKVWQILRGNPKMLTEIKEKTNYDGFIIFENNPQDIVNGEENITKDFIAYENNQYKSADGRNTTFFMDVEDFRFEKGGVTQHTL